MTRDQFRKSAGLLIYEIRHAKTSQKPALDAAALLEHAASLLERPSVNETDLMATIAILLESIAPVTEKRFRRQWCVGTAKKFDTAVNKLREMFNYEESK